MAEVSVEYIVIRNGVEFAQLHAYRGGGGSIAVTSDAKIKWTLSGKFEPDSRVNYLTDRKIGRAHV